MNDEEFLHHARNYVSDLEIDTAYEMLQNPELTLSNACAHSGASKLVVMALQGKLKEAVIRRGRIAPGDRYVDPWREAGCLDRDNKHLLAAFAIYRTVEPRQGEPQLCERGARVN